MNLDIVQSDKIEHPSVSITGGQGLSVGVRVELPGERNTTHGVQVPAGEQSVQDIGRIVSAVATQVDFEELASDQEENILSLVSDVEISGDSGQDKNTQVADKVVEDIHLVSELSPSPEKDRPTVQLTLIKTSDVTKPSVETSSSVNSGNIDSTISVPSKGNDADDIRQILIAVAEEFEKNGEENKVSLVTELQQDDTEEDIIDNIFEDIKTLSVLSPSTDEEPRINFTLVRRPELEKPSIKTSGSVKSSDVESTLSISSVKNDAIQILKNVAEELQGKEDKLTLETEINSDDSGAMKNQNVAENVVGDIKTVADLGPPSDVTKSDIDLTLRKTPNIGTPSIKTSTTSNSSIINSFISISSKDVGKSDIFQILSTITADLQEDGDDPKVSLVTELQEDSDKKNAEVVINVVQDIRTLEEFEPSPDDLPSNVEVTLIKTSELERPSIKTTTSTGSGKLDSVISISSQKNDDSDVKSIIQNVFEELEKSGEDPKVTLVTELQNENDKDIENIAESTVKDFVTLAELRPTIPSDLDLTLVKTTDTNKASVKSSTNTNATLIDSIITIPSQVKDIVDGSRGKGWQAMEGTEKLL